jgi:hypothetical protein
MSMSWQYFSFNEQRWRDLFGGGSSHAERTVICSAVWDAFCDEDLPDREEHFEQYVDALVDLAPRKTVELCKKICKDGISYVGLPADEAALLDQIVVGFFCPEGLEDALGYSYEHRNGLRSDVIEALRTRASPKKTAGLFGLGRKSVAAVELLSSSPIFSGRRYGSNQTPVEEIYFILSSEEVPLALAEIKVLLLSDEPWKQPDFKEAIEEELIQALESAHKQGRALAGRFT